MKPNRPYHYSGCSFDFIWNLDTGDYEPSEVEDDVVHAFEAMNIGCEVVGIDFESVDYSNFSDYSDLNDMISQCSIDFKWWGDSYDSKQIEQALTESLAADGYQLIGIDFYSLG